MNYRQILQRTRQEHVLYSVLLELTYRCNLDCFYCYNDKDLAGTTLSLAEYRTLLDELTDMGVMEITLSGGEPLAHPDFMAIGRHARDLGFVVRIKSNGFALDARKARRIREEIDPFIIELSLHGATADTHDRQTRVEGSFDRLLDNIGAMQDAGLRLRLNATLTAWNEHELDGMYGLAERLGLGINIDDQVTQRDDGDPAPLGIEVSTRAARELLELRERRAEKARKRTQSDSPANGMPAGLEPAGSGLKLCGAGCSTLLVDPFGVVYPCVNWRRAVGNLREQSVSDIWRASRGLELVRNEQVRVREALKVRGDLQAGVPFCPGVAEREAGDASRRYGAVERGLAARAEPVDGAPVKAVIGIK